MFGLAVKVAVIVVGHFIIAHSPRKDVPDAGSIA
jgi:hypothetical protein